MIKTILAAVSGGSASPGAIELACHMAERFNAHVEGFHVLLDPQQFLMATGFDSSATPQLLDDLIEESRAKAAKTKEDFVRAAARHGLPILQDGRTARSASWREEPGYAPSSVAGRGRFFDLIVLGRSDRIVDQPYSDTVERTLLSAGRAVLLAPAKAPDWLGETIAIGWDGTASAVHAVASALDLLAAARKVVVITVGKTNETADGAAMADYLAWHGIAATPRPVVPTDHGVAGEMLLATARAEGADLLVMGGYGHAPWRESLFGGTTRQIIGTSLMSVLLAH